MIINGIIIALMRDDVTLFLVTSKRDLVVKISRELKRNIVHIEHVCWKFYKMKNRQNDSINLVLIPTKPRFGVKRTFCDVIFHFVEFPTDMFDVYYIPLEFPRNLHHQVSF